MNFFVRGENIEKGVIHIGERVLDAFAIVICAHLFLGYVIFAPLFDELFLTFGRVRERCYRVDDNYCCV